MALTVEERILIAATARAYHAQLVHLDGVEDIDETDRTEIAKTEWAINQVL